MEKFGVLSEKNSKRKAQKSYPPMLYQSRECLFLAMLKKA
ncbi:hypothetical protein L683_18320 [Pseudomonas aeruginosa WC55]|nr:hypothetical protein L683_18320 [Pseudomonas aeruginosa WC55]